MLCMVGGAHFFVGGVSDLARRFGVAPMVLSTILAPIATELPEKFNSVTWIRQRKDTLAVGNVTGAMVLQGTLPVSLGLIGTEWNLAPSALATMGLVLVAVGFSLGQLLWGGHWRPWLLSGTALLYVGYALYLYGS